MLSAGVHITTSVTMDRRKYTCISGSGCSKLTTSLVNVSLKFQTLIFDFPQYFC